MNSGTQQDAALEKQETSAMSKFQAVELTLTLDQYTVIQHFLPKGYTLQERKSTKREKGSSHKLIDAEMSRFSGGFENTQEIQGRSKRARTKKVDRYLEEEIPRVIKRNTQKLSYDEEMNHCAKIMQQLKKNPNAIPFLEPVDPKKSGASHYFDIIKDPMDLSTIERNLKQGEYHTATQFHADISKIWYNSYAYNEKSSRIYKLTIEMQKFYKKLLTQDTLKKSTQLKNRNKGGQKGRQGGQYHQNSPTQQMHDENEGHSKSKNQHSGNNDYDV